ncbi:MAG: PD-(D/E)XK nuclease family protein [Oscillospiraceae bacterium]|nr:PD-(D/E)XK nuclease family protein [Oscillospiraceae bacterium]
MRVVWSRAGRGGEEALLSALLENAARGERCVWIVPEPYSHATERLLAEKGGAPICLMAEVLTFGRLCDRILASGGGLASGALDAGGRLLVMRRAVRAAAGRLKTLNAFAAKPGFLPGLIQTLDECKRYGITPQHLEQAGGHKLRDLALIFSAYDLLCEGGQMDPRDRVTLAWEKAKDARVCANTHIYVSHFTSFTPQERLLLKRLADGASSFTLFMRGGAEEPGFAPLHETARRFTQKHMTIDNPDLSRAPALRHMEKHWFDRKPAAFQGGAEGVIELYAAPGEAAEVRLAAERVVALARDFGFRWREIAVIASDYQAYAPLIEAIFPQYHIPVFSDMMDDMAQKPLSRCIRAAANCLRYGYRADDVMRLLRSGLLPVPLAAADLMDGYLRRWNPRWGRFSGQTDWTRPISGWHGEPTEKELSELAGLNALRKRISRAVKQLSSGKTARQCAAALLRTLSDLGIPEGIAARTEALAAADEGKLANECAQMWELLTKSLDQCVGFLQDEPMEAQEFCELCLLVLSGYSVGSIPASLDRVHTGDQSRYPRLPFRAVVYIGASQEKVPARTGGEGMLSAEEREALAGIGCELPPDPPARIKRELYNLYTACTLPGEKLILTYPQTQGGKGDEDGRAEIVDRLAGMFGLQVRPVPPPALPLLPVPISRAPLSGRNTAALYGKTLHLSASRVEAYSLCPFAYFCRYGLRAEVRPEPGFTPLDVGRELHILLERCAKYALERGGVAAVSREELTLFAEREAKERMEVLLRRGNMGTPRLMAQGARLTRVASILAGRLWDEFIHSRFCPLGFELFVEGDETPLRGTAEDAPSAYKLRGVADRVDGYRKGDTLYLRVIDYKTGGKEFSLSDVRNGLSAQMPLYLFLLRKQARERFGVEKAEAAGVLYVKTRDLLTDPGAKHSGLLLDDSELLKAMDDRPGGGMMPVWFNLDGSISKRASVVSPDGMGDLQKHIGRLVREMAQAVASGSLAAAPLKLRESPCARCGFWAACHFDGAVDTPRPYEVIR